MKRLKVGAVSYLNTKPLVYGLERRDDQIELFFDLPSRLADRLSGGDLDVGLIPSIEAITNPEYTIISDACIGCRGPVWSVKLLSRVPGDQIRTLKLDEGSRTSRVLGRIVLAKMFGVTPVLSQLNMNDHWQSSDSDAILIIGDRAMAEAPADFPYVWDLGETWNRWTGLPFVFAVWAAKTRTYLDRLDSILSQARDLGVGNVDSIIEKNAPLYRMSNAQCRRYLTENLHFHMGSREKRGLELYFNYAAELNLIAPNLRLQFYDCQTS